jgi:DNA-directed RNA polymerase subunit RPC12/RpoP
MNPYRTPAPALPPEQGSHIEFEDNEWVSMMPGRAEYPCPHCGTTKYVVIENTRQARCHGCGHLHLIEALECNTPVRLKRELEGSDP